MPFEVRLVNSRVRIASANHLAALEAVVSSASPPIFESLHDRLADDGWHAVLDESGDIVGFRWEPVHVDPHIYLDDELRHAKELFETLAPWVEAGSYLAWRLVETPSERIRDEAVWKFESGQLIVDVPTPAVTPAQPPLQSTPASCFVVCTRCEWVGDESRVWAVTTTAGLGCEWLFRAS